MTAQNPPDHHKLARRPFAIAALTLICLALAATAFFFLSAQSRAQEAANRVKCHKTLKALGFAVFQYTEEFRGFYPPRIEELMLTADIASEIFICPSSNDTPATGATLLERTTNLTLPGHCSYQYIAKGKANDHDQDTILMYEPMKNHGDGFHAVFADLHVEFITGLTAVKIQTELQSGQNPPPSHPRTPPPNTQP